MADELMALTEDLVSEFQEKLEPIMSNLKKAKLAFDDLSGM